MLVHVFNQKALQIGEHLLMDLHHLIDYDCRPFWAAKPSGLFSGTQQEGHWQACRLAQCSLMRDSCST